MNETQILKAVMTTAESEKIKSSINIEQLYKDKAQDIVSEQLSNLANARAEREPLPSVIMDALDTTNEMLVNTSVGPVKIRKLVAVDMTIFKLIDSPFYKLIMGDLDSSAVEQDTNKVFKQLFPDEELLFSLVYQFSYSAKEIYKLVKKGKDTYHEAVINEMIDKSYTPSDLTLLVESILKHVGMSNSAKVSFEANEMDEDKKKQI